MILSTVAEISSLILWGIYNQCLLRYSTIDILRSSSIIGYLHFKQYSILVWLPKLKYEIWGRSDQWLLTNTTFNILWSYSNSSLTKTFYRLFVPPGWRLKVEENTISGCWGIPILLFWCCLPSVKLINNATQWHHLSK